MAEKLPNKSPENQNNSAEIEASAAEQSRKNIERIKQLAEQEKSPDDKAFESLREKVESASIGKQEITVESEENKRLPDFDQGTLKRNSFNKSMSKVQAKLPPAERVLSKVIHQKQIETISNIGGKTVARPSGVLGGGFIALIGTMIVLYFARHYGFEYNNTLFILLYVGGFGGGLLIESLFKLSKRTRQ